MSSKKITASGLEELKKKLYYLENDRRNEILKAIEIAKGFGDLSENAEYTAAREDQSKNETEILALKEEINNAEVIADEEITGDKVNLGTTVRILDLELDEEEVYSIVGTREADPMNNKISLESPYGIALVGKRAGDVVTVIAPDGEFQLKILSIARTADQAKE
ncbi:MAG: transcription elongation factor GreA [Clostridia bacterium]|nr:transcription elongation factor GreA [Clostridia bacterium]